MDWIISANENLYNCEKAFGELELVDWVQRRNYEVGEYIYIYSVNPFKKIKYKCEVVKTNIMKEDLIPDKECWATESDYEQSKENPHMRLKLLGKVDCEELSYDNLLQHGLKGSIRGPIKLDQDKSELKEYIERYI